MVKNEKFSDYMSGLHTDSETDTGDDKYISSLVLTRPTRTTVSNMDDDNPY